MIDWIQTHLNHKEPITWWFVVGMAGNLLFFSRIVLQWYATEKMKQVVVPVAFWWLSLAGSLMLLVYAIFGKPSLVYILSFAFTWIPYLRNIIIHNRHLDAQKTCPKCSAVNPPQAGYCAMCGAPLAAAEKG
jgi:lipid-A-disaccharide synthase-like uncharacterized protein